MDSGSALRAELASPALLRLPGIFDGISAHLVRRAGFHGAYVTGAGIAAAGFGLPDIGLTTATEMVDRITTLIQACGLPVIADADTGYGNPVHVVRTVRAYETAGVAALHLEDQAFPKRCGHLNDKQLVDVDTYLRKLDAALNSRRSELVIIARTDARGPLGMDAAITRARRYAAAGADAIFVEAPHNVAEVQRIAAEVTGVPLVFNVVPGGRSPDITDRQLERLGFAAAIYPGALLTETARSYARALTSLGGDHVPVDDGPAGLFELVGLDEWTELGERYSKGG